MDSPAVTLSAPLRKWKLWLAAPAVALAAMALVWAFSHPAAGGADLAPGMTYTVTPVDMDVKIVKDGELQAVNNLDINCNVEGSTTIQTLVKEGASVHKDDVLVTLDSSAIKQRIEDTTLDLQKAENDLTTAQEMKSIQESTNATNLDAATVALTLAQLDLKQYDEGTYPQLLAAAQSDAEMAQINLKNQEDKLGQTRQLFVKKFVTETSVKDDEIAVSTARASANKAETALKVLSGYTHEMDRTSKQSALSQAEQKLVRTRRENAANLAQRVGDVQAKESALAVLKRRMEHVQQQFDACTIKAPADGLVVYASSVDRNAQNPIQEGAQVREHQLLLRLPDTRTMSAVIRVQEAQVSRISEGLKARVQIVGLPGLFDAKLAKISVLADNGQRWWNPDLKEYPVDLYLDQTPAGLKPGMGCQADVFIDRATDVCAVPLTSVYSVGSESFVFVRQGEDYAPRKMRVGRTNDTLVEVLDGVVKPAEQVLILQAGEGQRLLDKAGITVAPAASDKEEQESARRSRRARATTAAANKST